MTLAVDSSTAGYLRSTSGPMYEKELEDLFHEVIQGITGLPGNLVRPAYQDDPPTWPQFDTNWCAFRVYVEPVLYSSYKTLVADLTYTVEGTEVLQVTASFYGPQFQEVERSWRDGLQLSQNRDALAAAGIEFIQFADPVVVPVFMKEKWVKKIDIRGTFHRWAVRTYKVRSLVSADGTIHADQTPEGEIIGTFHTDPPPSS